MTHDCITLVDDGAVEILVGYNALKVPAAIEEFHGYHVTEGGWDIELTSFEVVIKGVGIDILDKLSDKQKEAIINEVEETL